MKISDLIKRLEDLKEEVGNAEVQFANDEEGNLMHDDCVFSVTGTTVWDSHHDVPIECGVVGVHPSGNVK